MPKRISLLFALLLACITLFSQEDTWFHDIKAPLQCGEEQLVEFTGKLREGLLAHKSQQELLSLLPVQDDQPRVIFLTLNDGIFPGRTYYAAGKSLQDAFQMLLVILEKREPEYAAAITADLEGQIARAQEEKRLLPAIVKTKLANPTAWNSLRFDIVQAVLPVDNFMVSSSRLLLSSIVGLAFDRTAAFAFPPEQLTGRYLMNEERQLSISRVSNLISEANLWSALGLWQRMGAAQTPFKVTLFETDSYYADNQGARRLFRAHPIRTANDPSPMAYAALAVRCLDLLDPVKGTVKPPFPEWVTGRRGEKTGLYDQAMLATAFLDACQDVPEKSLQQEFLTSVKVAVKPLLKAIKHLDYEEELENGQIRPGGRKKAGDRPYALVVEDEYNPYASEMELPARVSELRTNALTYLLFQRLADLLPLDDKTAAECRKELEQLHRHIATQISEDGSCIPAVFYPTRKPKLSLVGDDPLSTREELETAALVGLAMEFHRKHFSKDDTEATQAKIRHLRDFLGMSMEENLEDAPFSPALALFLSQDATAENPKRLVQLTRLALAAVEGLELAPGIPDMFGCDADIPSMTYAAERLTVVSIIARTLAKAGKAEDGMALLQEAWPLWVFQQQANMGSEVSSILPLPQQYLGFQRDNLADFGFTLNGQSTQLLAMAELLKAMDALQMERFEPTPELRKAWEKCWEHLGNHPLCLVPELVLPGIATEDNSRAMGGTSGAVSEDTYTVTDANLVIKPGNGKQNYVETRVIDRNKPAKKGKKKR